MHLQTLTSLNAYRLKRETVAEVVNLTTGATQLVLAGEPVTDEVSAAAVAAISSGISRAAQIGNDTVFFNVHRPPTRLAIVGAVHISQALAPMARSVGMEVAIIDPREAFASQDRFPGTTMFPMWPDEAFGELMPDERTALVAVTHDPKIDDPAIEKAIDGGCFYIGALGSRRTHQARIVRLTERGYSRASLDKIRAPIGLSIGTRQPAEIAVAILAEIIECQNSRTNEIADVREY